jgi:pimeloyl-ACP methyl ester carboxylesterase
MNEQFKFFECTGSQNRTIRGSLHIANQESGKPWFVICHGLTGQRMGPGYLFVKISRHLSALGFSSARFDFCGSGESDGAFHEMSIASMQADLEAVTLKLIEQYNPRPMIIVGHSFGGMIAALCSNQIKPDGLVLISPVGDPGQIVNKKKDIINSGPNSDGFIEYGPHEMNVKGFENLLTLDPVNYLAQHFKGKLLVVQGSTDHSIPVEESKRYIDSARKADIITDYHLLNGADHNYSRVTDTKMLCQIISSWSKERFQ